MADDNCVQIEGGFSFARVIFLILKTFKDVLLSAIFYIFGSLSMLSNRDVYLYFEEKNNSDRGIIDATRNLPGMEIYRSQK